MKDVQIFDAPIEEISARKWHDISKLRIDVFVVEQTCAYAELDGRDLEYDARHIWLEMKGGPSVAAYLRLLVEPGGLRIGRVVTHSEARGNGYAGQLMRYALERSSGPWILHAQSHLAGWYGQFGFNIEGEPFLEDDIEHVLMRLAPP